MLATIIENKKMLEIKSKVILPIRLLSIVLFILVFYSCKGQEVENATKEKIEESSKQKKENYQPLIYNQEATTPQQHSTLNGIVSEFVWQMYQDKNDNFWFCTNHDGVVVYDGKSLRQFTPNDGLGGNAVRNIVEDNSGNIWLGTSNGLTKYNGITFTNYNTKDGLIDNEIWAVEIDKKGIIWVGTVGGVSKFNGTSFETFVVPKPEVSNPESMLSENRISDILIDKNGHFWFVNDGYGISKYNGKLFEFYTKENGLPDNNVADVFEDRQANIWIGTYYGGVSKYDGKTFTNFTKEGIIEGIETYNFCEDNEGNIWFSAENYGVYRYDGKEFTQFTKDDGLATNTIQSIFADKKKQIWFGTWDGLSLYDGKTIVNASDKEPWAK